MTRAAIYARRSTDEHQAASLDVQLGEARTYCESRGWAVEEAHVFIEDAVSRAEFVKRPALIRMLNAAKDNEFDVIVVRDETRLGGDVTRTGLLIQDILEAGCQLYYYFSDEQVTLDGAVDKFMVAARNFAAELEREKISQRTREHLMVKARQGLNAGGRCYGYENVRVGDHTEYRIDEAQAEVVRDVFRRYADGAGYTSIARALNDRGVPPPAAGKRGTGSWSRSQVRSMLMNERYRGVVTWGRSHKTYRGGTKVRVSKPACEVLRIEVPELAIVDDALWEKTRERVAKNRKLYKNASFRNREPRHLLTGLARCAECGGPIRADSAKWGGKTIKLYACKYNRSRGRSVCTNGLRRPVEEVDAAIIDHVRRNILSEAVVIEVVREIRHRLKERSKTTGPDLAKLEEQARKLRNEIGNLGEAIAAMGGSPSLTEKLAERESRLKRIEGQIEAAQPRRTPWRRRPTGWRQRRRSGRASSERSSSESLQASGRPSRRCWTGRSVSPRRRMGRSGGTGSRARSRQPTFCAPLLTSPRGYGPSSAARWGGPSLATCSRLRTVESSRSLCRRRRRSQEASHGACGCGVSH